MARKKKATSVSKGQLQLRVSNSPKQTPACDHQYSQSSSFCTPKQSEVVVQTEGADKVEDGRVIPRVEPVAKTDDILGGNP
ncbi:hypothetical protein RIF29_18857 [Crotalaria pallida]|uniref:Uncharacterized protein n=1 Tax=Crotalaria pallida TaxID=3830 RepID=A0AAN9I774_CROPI